MTVQTSQWPKWFTIWSGGALAVAALGTLVVLGGRAGLYGSSRINVDPLSASNPSSGPIYYLPQARIGLQANYRVTKCDVTRPQEGPEVVTISADVGARLNNIVEPDFSRGYVIDANSITGSWWRTDLTIVAENGVLKSVNAISTAEHKVPKELQLEAVVAQIARTAGTTFQRSGEQALSVEERRVAICGAALVDFLKKGGRPEDNPATVNRFFRFDPASSTCPQDTVPVGGQGAGVLVCAIPAVNTVATLLGDQNAVADQLTDYTLHVRIVSSGRAPAPQPPKTRDLVYRTSGVALATVCLRQCGGGRVLDEQWFSVPQLGSEGSIPIERRLFSNRTVKLDFGPAGDLIKLQFTDGANDAPATGAAGETGATQRPPTPPAKPPEKPPT
jgi:hypothetical protein